MKKNYSVFTFKDDTTTKRAEFGGGTDCRQNFLGAIDFAKRLTEGNENVVIACGEEIVWANCFIPLDLVFVIL
jgi:hypothetical protein